MKKIIIFDLDGVIIDSRKLHYECLNTALGEIGEQYVIYFSSDKKSLDTALPNIPVLPNITILAFSICINKLSIESFDVYRFLNKEFKNTEGITKNNLFQFVFRSLHILDNAVLTPEFKTRKDLNSIQFSFVTKFANIIDNQYPIYDSEVIKLFNFK